MNRLSIFDTHCHLVDEKYEASDISAIIQAAKNEGINYILNVGYDKKSNEKVIKHLKKFSNLFGSLGLHPNSFDDLREENLEWIESQLTNKKIIAIGEIGLDYYRTFTPHETQKYWFKRQLELAKKHNLPVLLHIREAFSEAYQIVKESGIKKGILHCFTGDWEIAKQFIKLGFYVSFAGNITYENSKWQKRLEEVVKETPLRKIVVETDAPYLSPSPLRGQINYPHNIIHTLRKISEIKNKEIKEIASVIYSNTLLLFDLL